ncbi:hypothetical protein ACHAXH_004973 [Discostella pseudostelligera]
MGRCSTSVDDAAVGHGIDAYLQRRCIRLSGCVHIISNKGPETRNPPLVVFYETSFGNVSAAGRKVSRKSCYQRPVGGLPLLDALWCNAPSEIVEFSVENYKVYHPDYTIDWERMLETLISLGAPVQFLWK